jgi:GT2 family glycosyltransferase
MDKKGLLVTVNYKVADDTLAYLDSLKKLTHFCTLDVIIVDNASDAAVISTMNDHIQRNGLKNTRLLLLGENKGYFKAAKYAIATTNIDQYEFIIVSNNDIVIKDKDFLVELKNKINKSEVIAPKIISLVTNRDQNPHRETAVSVVQKLMYKLFFINYPLAKILVVLRMWQKQFLKQDRGNNVDIERRIFSAQGSFMIFNKRYFDMGGYIDDNYFLFGEEDSVAAICRMKGLNITYFPELVVYHNEHRSTNSDHMTKDIYRQQKDAYLYIKNRYKGFY